MLLRVSLKLCKIKYCKCDEVGNSDGLRGENQLGGVEALRRLRQNGERWDAKVRANQGGTGRKEFKTSVEPASMTPTCA